MAEVYENFVYSCDCREGEKKLFVFEGSKKEKQKTNLFFVFLLQIWSRFLFRCVFSMRMHTAASATMKIDEFSFNLKAKQMFT